MTTASVTAYGTTPSYSTPYDFTVMSKVTDDSSTSTGWQLKGRMGTANYSFGGKSWNVLYWSLQAAKNAVTNSKSIQVWMQLKHFDGKATADNSFYNISTLFVCSSNVASYTCNGSDTFSNGATDLLTGVKTAALNKGTAAGTVGSATAAYQVKGYNY